ncbi:hypothetical protein CCAL_1363 [Campylobacter californiensis]|nr:hypothetical protein CCAL_1363 [Campylobacter sp. RM6914]
MYGTIDFKEGKMRYDEFLSWRAMLPKDITGWSFADFIRFVRSHKRNANRARSPSANVGINSKK